jgi:hypothetical protein
MSQPIGIAGARIACRNGTLAISCAERLPQRHATWTDLALSFGMFFAVLQSTS